MLRLYTFCAFTPLHTQAKFLLQKLELLEMMSAGVQRPVDCAKHPRIALPHVK